MRHRLATRSVIVLTVVLVLAALLWAGLARTAITTDAEARAGTVLEHAASGTSGQAPPAMSRSTSDPRPASS